MLRNFISKLPGFTTLSELPTSTSCNSRMLRTLSPVQTEHRRKIQRNENCRTLYRGSYSFPSTRPRSYEVDRSRQSTFYKNSVNEESQSRRLCSHQSSRRKGKSSKTGTTTSQKKNEEEEDVDEGNDSKLSEKDFYEKFQASDQYEIDGSRPRKSQSQINFNVFDYNNDNTEKENDHMSYLQPNKLKPFGSTNNDYIHATPRAYAEYVKKYEDIESTENANKTPRKQQNTESVQKREYSTKTFQRLSGTENLIQDLPPFQITKLRSNIFLKKSSTNVPKPKYEDQSSESPKTNFYQYHDDAVSTTRSLAEELPVRNRAVTSPPKPAYSETMLAQKHFLSNANDLIYGEHIAERTIPPLKSTISDQEIAPKRSTVWKIGSHLSKQPFIKHSFLHTDTKLLNKGNIMMNEHNDVKKRRSSTSLHPNDLLPPHNLNAKCYSRKTKQNKEKYPFEPDPCEKTDLTKKCFLPSKIRLKPPICTPKPPPCPLPEPCVRADDTVVFKYKPLPILKPGEDCPCITPYLPTQKPKMKRLKFDFPDPIKICPIDEPCTNPRADDFLPDKPKKLKPLIPKECRCIEPPPLIDVPLKRLKKVCIPPAVCKPPRICPEPEPCVRADDDLVEKHKELPIIEAKACPCIIEPPQLEAPKMKRLYLKVAHIKKPCPVPCVCKFDCPRADDTLPYLQKKLPKLIPGDCPCVDQPMEDVEPLKRLVCVDEPEECYEVDPCIEIPRADMGCWEYYVPVDKNAKKENKCVNHNSKRKYNTDSRFNEKVPSKSEESRECDYNDVVDNLKNNRTSKISAHSTTVNFLNKLTELDNSTVQEKRSESRYIPPKTPTMQMQNIRNLSSKVENVYEKTTKQKSPLNERKKRNKPDTTLKPPNMCHQVDGKCPSHQVKGCAQIRDPCNKACKHIRPPIVCNKKTPPYPAFSDLLDESVVSYSPSTECKSNQREFEYHLEERVTTQPPKTPKKSDSNKKCFSTSAQVGSVTSRSEGRSKEIHRSNVEHNEMQENEPELKNLNAETSGHFWGRNQLQTDDCISVSEFPSNYSSRRSRIHEKDTPERMLNPQTPTNLQSYRSHSVYKKTPVEDIKVDLKNNKTPVKKMKPIQKDGDKASCESSTTYCPKMHVPPCPPVTKRTKCNKIFNIVCQKQQAPFKAFSDCLEGDLAENLAECPLEREKVKRLQPRYVKTLDKSRIVSPVTPRVGKLDLTAEDNCIRRNLCLEKPGVTQSCDCFKKPVKLMRARDMDKIREELKNQDDRKHVYHTQTARNCKRKFCTCAFNSLNVQKRGICICLGNNHLVLEENLENENTQSEINFRRRSYHLLCKTKERYLEEEIDERKDTNPYRSQDYIDDKTKSKVGSVQWRIDNFQKWHRLNKLNSHSTNLKRFYSCMELLKEDRRMYSTIVSNTVSFHAIEDDMSCRHISTSNSHSNKRTCIEPRKIGLPRSAEKCHKTKSRHHCRFDNINVVPECEYTAVDGKETPQISERIISEPFPNIGVVDYNLGREYMKIKYGIKNEGITQDCNTFGTPLRYQDVLFKHTDVKDTTEVCTQRQKEIEECEKLIEAKKQYSIQEELKCGEKSISNETKSEDVEAICSKIEENCKILDDLCKNTKKICEKCEKECRTDEKDCGRAEDDWKKADSSRKVGEEFLKSESVCKKCETPNEIKCLQPKKSGRPLEKQRLVFKGTSIPNKHDIKKSHSECDITSTKELHKHIPGQQSLCMDRRKKCETLKPTKAEPCSRSADDSVWHKIVNYFKARPGCPPPDEWKKKALRAKAEKAAKAAGLVVCDPKDLEKVNCSAGELPEVITSVSDSKKGEDQDDPCSSPKKTTMDIFQKRNFTTTSLAKLPQAEHFSDPLYIGQHLNKVIITIPLDMNHVNLTGSCRFPKILSCFCNFPLQTRNAGFLKHVSTSVDTKRFYSKHPDQKQLKNIAKTNEEEEKNENMKYFEDEQDFIDNIGNKKNSQDYFENQKDANSDSLERTVSLCKVPNQSLQRRASLVDIIFPEDLKENPEYSKAKAFAVFQEILNGFDAHSDISVEELEKLKTENMLRELDKLLDESGRTEKKNSD